MREGEWCTRDGPPKAVSHLQDSCIMYVNACNCSVCRPCIDTCYVSILSIKR